MERSIWHIPDPARSGPPVSFAIAALLDKFVPANRVESLACVAPEDMQRLPGGNVLLRPRSLVAPSAEGTSKPMVPTARTGKREAFNMPVARAACTEYAGRDGAVQLDASQEEQPTKRARRDMNVDNGHDWEALETEAMKRLRECGDGLDLIPDEAPDEATLMEGVLQQVEEIRNAYPNWANYAAPLQAGIIVAELASTAMAPDWGSAFFKTRLIAAALSDSMRAHEPGLFKLTKGVLTAKRQLDHLELIPLEIARKTVMRLIHSSNEQFEVAIAESKHSELIAQTEYRSELAHLAHRQLHSVDTSVQQMKTSWVKHTLTELGSLVKYWGKHASSILSHFCTWRRCKQPPVNSLIAFNDQALRFSLPVVKAVPRCDVEDCYVSIPASIAYKPADYFCKWFRKFFTTTIASDDGALEIELCIETLAMNGLRLPRHAVFYYGYGGNAKGSRSRLRARV